jgi:hypothetical protein
MLKKIGVFVLAGLMLAMSGANAAELTWSNLKTKSKSDQSFFILGVYEGAATMAVMSPEQTLSCSGGEYSRIVNTSINVLKNNPQVWNRNLAVMLIEIWKRAGICR